MNKLIKTEGDLKEHFFILTRNNSYNVEDNIKKGVFVDGKIRKETLTSESQGKTVINGRVRQIKFENLGGGVYRAFIDD
jgi:hypothetical protein